MNPQNPYNPQPQAGAPQPYPGQPSIQPQAEPLYSPAPTGYANPPQPNGGPAVAFNPQQPGQPAPNGVIYDLAPKPSRMWMIIGIVTIITTLGFAGAFSWSMVQYLDARDNTESKVNTAVNIAVKEQSERDAEKFLNSEKEPNRLFVGPDDYGRLSFRYPKTWSQYVQSDANRGGTYSAIFNPVTVPPTSTSQRYALRVTIEDRDYDSAVASYKSLVASGKLKASTVKSDDQNGTRLDGMFNSDINGSMVIFKIRDKTVTIRTDAETFRGDFDAIVKTITFNK